MRTIALALLAGCCLLGAVHAPPSVPVTVVVHIPLTYGNATPVPARTLARYHRAFLAVGPTVDRVGRGLWIDPRGNAIFDRNDDVYITTTLSRARAFLPVFLARMLRELHQDSVLGVIVTKAKAIPPEEARIQVDLDVPARDEMRVSSALARIAGGSSQYTEHGVEHISIDVLPADLGKLRAALRRMHETWIERPVLFDLYAAPMAAAPIAGYGVLVSGMQPMQAFARATQLAGDVVHVDMWEVANGAVVRRYDVDMTKLVHMIVVTDDLRLFEHVHPVLRSDGHFIIDLRLPRRTLYHVYLDGLAHGIGRTVFRFDVPVGSSAAAPARALHAAGDAVRDGPYVVRIDPTLLPVGGIATVAVTITKNGRPAADLHPYLGAMAHGVFVGVNDLAYMHAHGMSEAMLAMSTAADCGDAMMMSMPPLPPGAKVPSRFAFQVLAPRAQAYDFWLQFRGGSTLYTAPFLIVAR